jgi:serine/threonine protein kinase
MDLMGAEALLEETYLVLKHNIEKPEELESSSVAQVCQEKPDSASRDVIGRTEGCLDSLEWDEGFRIQISSSSGEWHVGTLEYISKDGDSNHSIAVMDDGSILKFPTESNDTVRRIHGPEPKETAHSLIAVFLKAANGKKRIAENVRKYLRGGQGGFSKLEAVALASKVLKEKLPGLKFLGVIGEGGFGTVLSVEGPTGQAVVKMELRRGHPNFTDISLWREFSLLQTPPKELVGHVPKLCNVFGSHSFARICSSNRTVSFLGMEYLVPHATTILHQNSLIENGSIPDSFRWLAQYQCLILEKMRAAGIVHGDIKNAHFMMRPKDTHVVLVDWGLSERSGVEYRTETAQCASKPSVGQLLYSSAALPARQGASASPPSLLRLGLPRPGTPGNRPQNTVHSFKERHQADVWALAVGWLEGVGLVPYSKGSAHTFEEGLYVSARSSFDDFSRFVAEYTDIGVHGSVITWLQLVYSVLHGGTSVLHLLNNDPALTQPFYAPSLLERLRTTGIIVPGVKGQGPKTKPVKPILMMHLEGTGLILLCLLYYLPGETVLFYGGPIVDKLSDEILLYPSHNLPIGPGQEILGAVSRYFSIEEFISESAVGSFAKSSNGNPKIITPGTLKRPQRLRHVSEKEPGGMAKVPMVARLAHGPGTEPTWPYDWNAAIGDAIFNEQKITVLQERANQAFPSHVWTAVLNARGTVLSEGVYTDAEVSAQDKRSLLIEGMPKEIYSGTSERGLDSTTLHCQDTEQPLSPDLVRSIEEAVASSGGKPQFQEIPDFRSSSIILNETAELIQHGFLVLDKIPARRTSQTDKALCAQGEGGQGILFMNGIELAMKSAKRLKEVVGLEDVLYNRVFGRDSADDAAAQPTSAKNASHKSVAENPSAASGGGACYNMRKRKVGASEWGEGTDENDDEGSESDSGHRSPLSRGNVGASEGQEAAEQTRSDEEGSEPDSQESSSGADGQSRGTGKSGYSGPITAWLLVVAAFMSSLPDKSWSVIFQKLNGSKPQRAGDGRRTESKGSRWKRPERGDCDSQDQFYDRMAGYYALRFFYQALFDAVTKILPYGSNISSQLFEDMYSLLSSDSSEGNVEAQDPHTDIRPVRSMRRFSTLINLSDLCSYLGILVNSCPNIKAMFDHEEAEFERFQQQFSRTESASQPGKLLSDVMGTGTRDSKVRFAWRHYFAKNRPGHFRDMYPVYAKMPPIMVAVFDTDTVHWGPPFPMPGIEYPISGVRLIHYR